MLRSLALLALCALATGCGDGGSGADAAVPVATTTPAPTATVTPEPSPIATPSPRPPAVLAAGIRSLLRSDDGGFTWEAEPVLPLGSAVDFVDGQVGWATGGGEIHHSTDGGRTWRREATELGPSPYFSDVAAVDPFRAVVAGNDGTRYTPDPVPGPPAIFFTDDAGATWQRSELIGVGPERSGLTMTSVCLTAGGQGLAIGGDYRYFASAALLLLTHDAGATWQTSASAPSTSKSAKIDCTDGGDLWIADGRTRLFHSADGGTTWRDLGVNLPDAGLLVAADFDDPSEGRLVAFANHRIVLLHTTDGGEHWTSREIPASTGIVEIFVAMDFHGPHGVCVLQDVHPLGFPRSSFGVAFATADGGATWTETVFPEPINALWDVVLLP